jgi:hypothetical protein
MSDVTSESNSASVRCSFQLTYKRSRHRRVFSPTHISGDDIADARVPGRRASGDWFNESDPTTYTYTSDLAPEISEKGWIEHYASMAINEAVHEALEWFHVDRRPWLDPHGPHEGEIYALVDQFARELVALQRRSGKVVDRSHGTA